MIYSIQGDFGSGKTSLAVRIAIKAVKRGALVLTNIDLDQWKLKNVHWFSDDELFQAVKTASLVNDIERILFTRYPKESVPKYERSKFTRIVVLFDEAGASTNGKDWVSFFKETGGAMPKYLNQNRKIFMDLYLVTVDNGQVNMDLRRAVNWSFESENLFGLKIWPFNCCKLVYRSKIDPETNEVRTKKKWGKDSNGQDVERLVPERYFETFYWAPSVWPFYDDLKKNIADDMRYAVKGPSGFDGFSVASKHIYRKFGGLAQFKDALARLPDGAAPRGLVDAICSLPEPEKLKAVEFSRAKLDAAKT